MTLIYRFAILLILVKVVLSVAYIVDSEEKFLGVDFENAYIVTEKTIPPGFLTKYFIQLFNDHDGEDEQRPFIGLEVGLEDQNDYEKNEENELEDEETPYLKIIPPLRRVRRRIIPRVTGKSTVDTSRRGNPWDRNRNPWHDGQSTGGDLRRPGPMGSKKLFALYPHLASRGLIEKNDGEPQKKNQTSNQIEEEAEQIKDVGEMYQGDSSTKVGTNISVVKRREPKIKSKMPKKIKEEIAEYALQHGNDEAQEHFQSKLGVRIRPAAVEKFVRRLRGRMERRKLREEMKYK